METIVAAKEVSEMFAGFKLRGGKVKAIDIGLGLWLIWRRAQGRPVTGRWVEKNISGVTHFMVENFFSKQHGIKTIKDLSLAKLCLYFRTPLISEEKAAQLISDIEATIGKDADQRTPSKKIRSYKYKYSIG
jgi:hypothetical protein